MAEQQKPDDFEAANAEFGLMTLPERRRVLEKFATLRYPHVADRFFEAVHATIVEGRSLPRDEGALDGKSEQET